ncbi:MAG: ribosomal RNA adenine dimethylase domain-containing protein [bacterium]|nr:ribosomal RNA adenine dimethylase domain-containing protein [bacterium]
MWPSSPYLSDKITSDIGVETADSVVELGPGTGVFTKVVLEKKKADSKFIVVELNKTLFDIVKSKFPGLTIYNDSAANLNSLIKKENVDSVDIVLCGLPWASFPAALQISILEAVHTSLKDGGIFTTFAYLQGAILPTGIRFRKLLSSYFSKVETTKTVWRNIPPAFVYRCTK